MLLNHKMATGVFKRLEKMELQWEHDELTANYHVDYSNEIKLKGLFPTSVHLYALRNRTNGKMFAFVLGRRGSGRIIPINEFYYSNNIDRRNGINLSGICFDMLHGADHHSVDI